MKSSSSLVIFSSAAAIAALFVVCCLQQADAAPRNRMPHRNSNNNNDNDNDSDNQYQQGGQQRYAMGRGEQQVDPEESNQSEINDESGAVDPEFATLTDDGSPESAASNSEGDETADEPAPDGPATAAAGDGTFNQLAAGRNSWLDSTNSRSGADGDYYGGAGEARLSGQDSNIANAKVKLSSADLSTAAGHHHHHGHGVHGWLEMGAHTGKKGAFGWHDKHPVGGKGRR